MGNRLKKHYCIFCVLLLFTMACIQPISLVVWLEHLRNEIQQNGVHIDISEIIPENNLRITSSPTVHLIPLTHTPIPSILLPTKVPTETREDLSVVHAVGDPQGRIIFTCQVDKNPSHDQICMIRPDGSDFRQLTSDMDVQHFYPSWAPEGNSIVFSGAQTGEFKLYEMDLQGDMHIVGDISGNLFAPMISPDGSKIVFTRHFSESEQYISVCDRDGNNVRNLTNFYDAKDPVWSDDGLTVSYTHLTLPTKRIV